MHVRLYKLRLLKMTALNKLRTKFGFTRRSVEYLIEAPSFFGKT